MYTDLKVVLKIGKETREISNSWIGRGITDTLP
jgi:hypothetical protein